MAPPNLTLEQFSGPLDLLLGLIAEEKLDITTIALSRVTEQYLAYLDRIEEKDAQELADFLVVATRLLLLKSRALIPQLMPEADDGPSLEAQLRLYKVFVDASKKMQRLWNSTDRAEWRQEPPRRSDTFVPPENASIARLHGTMVQLVNRLRPPKALPRTVIDKSISVQEKIDRIRELFRAIPRLIQNLVK
jgi:segregation and condensation protein A